MTKITFIGGGNMAAAIVGGLIANGTAAENITIVEPNAEQRARLSKQHGVAVSDDVCTACADADTIVLAVKPQIIPVVAEQIDTDLSDKILISIAAGVTVATLEDLFGPIAIARTMPNTPALLGLGATGVFLNEHVSEAHKETVKSIIQAFGICVMVESEELLDAVTAVSGSGPAYYFLMIEEMIKAGKALGLSSDDAQALTLQTALGAATMAANGEMPAAELRARVTSPNGTTHAALTVMQENGFGEVIAKAMNVCHGRAVELGKG